MTEYKRGDRVRFIETSGCGTVESLGSRPSTVMVRWDDDYRDSRPTTFNFSEIEPLSDPDHKVIRDMIHPWLSLDVQLALVCYADCLQKGDMSDMTAASIDAYLRTVNRLLQDAFDRKRMTKVDVPAALLAALKDFRDVLSVERFHRTDKKKATP